jgi:hypothetical protein
MQWKHQFLNGIVLIDSINVIGGSDTQDIADIAQW